MAHRRDSFSRGRCDNFSGNGGLCDSPVSADGVSKRPGRVRPPRRQSDSGFRRCAAVRAPWPDSATHPEALFEFFEYISDGCFFVRLRPALLRQAGATDCNRCGRWTIHRSGDYGTESAKQISQVPKIDEVRGGAVSIWCIEASCDVSKGCIRHRVSLRDGFSLNRTVRRSLPQVGYAYANL